MWSVVIDPLSYTKGQTPYLFQANRHQWVSPHMPLTTRKELCLLLPSMRGSAYLSSIVVTLELLFQRNNESSASDFWPAAIVDSRLRSSLSTARLTV